LTADGVPVLNNATAVTVMSKVAEHFKEQNIKSYVGVLINLWLFLFPICSTSKIIFLGWDKEVRTTKS
jgi:hypothetical protein